MQRPEGVTMIAIWYFTLASFSLLGLGGMTIAFLGLWTGAGNLEDVLFGTLAMILVVMAIVGWGAAHLATGIGLWHLKDWSRSAAKVLAILDFLFVPLFGLVAGIMVLVYLGRNREAKSAFGLTDSPQPRT